MATTNFFAAKKVDGRLSLNALTSTTSPIIEMQKQVENPFGVAGAASRRNIVSPTSSASDSPFILPDGTDPNSPGDNIGGAGSPTFSFSQDFTPKSLAAAEKLKTVVKKTRFQRYQEALDPGDLTGNSFFALGPEHNLRLGLKSLLWHPVFDMFYLLVIVGWSGVMWAMDPLDVKGWYTGVNVAIAIFFSVVAVLRFVVMWVPAFVKSGWCMMDLSAAVSVWCELFVFSNWKVSLVPFLLMRVLIPISGLFVYFNSTRTILHSLKRSLAPLMYINLAMFFFFFSYGILTLQSYSSSMTRRCIVDSIQAPTFPLQYCKNVNTEKECGIGKTCQVVGNPEKGYDGFDNIGLALLSLFEIHSMDDWVNRFLNPMLFSEPRFRILTWVITGTTILFVSLIVINLFVAVIVDSFAECREEDKERRKEAQLLKQLELAEFNAMIEAKLGYKKTPLTIKLREFLELPAVQWTFAANIVGNTIAMVAESIDAPQSQQDAVDAAEWAFGIIFCVELVMYVVAYGPKYFMSASNVVDSGSIVINLFALIFLEKLRPVSAISMVRNIRVAMLFRPLRALVEAVLQSVETVVNMALVMCMSIISFAIVGKQLFAKQMPVTRSHFDTVPNGFFTLFQVLSGDDWLQSMFSAVEFNGTTLDSISGEARTRIATAFVFYLFFFIWGNYIITNLLIACILENFKILEGEDQVNDDDDDYRGMLMSTNKFRNFLQRIARSKPFERFAVIAVLASSLLMCLTGPPGREDIVVSKRAISIFGAIFTVIFSAECVIKVIALGPIGYITNGWNAIDFTALALTLIDTVVGNLPGGRVFRALRIVRSLKVVGKNEDMQNVINAIIMSLKTMFYVILLYLTLVLLFALFGRNFFGGKFRACVDTASIVYPLGKFECLGTFTQTLDAGDVLMPRAWVNPQIHFDRASNAFIALYISVHGVWTGIAFGGMDVTGMNQQPKQDFNWAYSFFFILFQFIARFFVASLFVAVIIEYYQKVQEKTKPTPLQRDWNHTFKVQIPEHLFRTIKEPVSARRQIFFRIMRSGIVRTSSIVVVSINCLFLCSFHANQPPYWTAMLMWVDIWCVIFYSFEVFIKVMAYGLRTWYSQGWFVFEAFIWFFAIIAIIPEYAYDNDWAMMLGRVFRILRVLRFIDFIPSLRFLFRTMLDAALPLLNVILLMAIVNSIFAVVGVNIFGNVRDGQYFSVTDYSDFISSSGTLFKALTGDSWEVAMHDGAIAPPFCTPDNLDKNFFGDCGTSVSFPFYVLYTLIAILIMLNVLVAVIVNQFASYYQRLKQEGVMDPEVMDLFKEYWDFAEFRINQDRYGGRILIQQLDLFLARTNQPLTLRSGLRVKARIWPRMYPAPLFFT
jgi:hypothetical protein